ncbi:hypothetical protein [Andreprevotia chitinilytica]|uniref:hypothetical protein n=1 Tax=Andreprevotia chitinilytica TaxID=396808 RepID=UPI000550E2F5|nr:hypothetical protein [Andreprevotia chitinilytica]
MIVEMQLKSEPIKRMVRNAVKAARICTTESQAGYYLDHISVGQPTLSASDATSLLAGTGGFQTKTLQIHQPADAFLVQLTDLQNTPDFAPVDPAHLTAASVDIVMAVTLSIHPSGPKKGQPRFSVALVGVNGTNTFGNILAPQLQGQVQFNQGADLDLAALTALTQTAPKPIINCGVAASSDGSHMSLRFEMGDTPILSAADWTAFMAGGISDRLGALDWSIFVDAQSLDDALASQMNNAIKGTFDQINSGPTATWEPIGPTPGFAMQHVEADATIFNACTGLFGPVDMSFTLDLDLTITLPQPNVIRVDAAVDWHGNKWTEFWCAFSEIVAGPALFALFPDQGHSWVGGVMAFNPLGPIGNLALVIWAFNSDTVTGLVLPPISGFTKIDDTHYRSETVFTAPAGLPVTGMKLTSINGSADGIVLGGTLDPVIELNDPVLSIKSWSDTGFGWVNPDPCNQFGQQLQAQILFDESPYYLFMCPPVFLSGDDPANEYANSIAEWDQKGIEFVLNTINPGFAPGYDCKVLLLTTGGARYIRLTKPASLQPFASPEDQLKYELGVIAFRATNCYKATSIWGSLGMYNPHWSVDPEVVIGQPAEQVEHGWSFAVAGLEAGEHVAIVDGAGTTLVTGIASPQGVMTLDALTKPVAFGSTELSVQRGGKGMSADEYNQRLKALMNGPALENKGTFAHRQTLLNRVGSVTLPAALTAQAIIGTAKAPQLVTIAGGVLRRHDLHVPARPRQLEERNVPGLHGVVQSRGQLLGFGDFGLANLAKVDIAPIWRTPVIDAVAIGDRIIVLDRQGITVLDETATVLTRAPLEGGQSLTASGRFIVVGLGNSVVAFERRRGDRFDRFGSLAIDASGGVAPAEALGARGAVYVRGDKSSALVTLTAKGSLQQTATYPGHPWFAGSAADGTLLARRSATGTAAEIVRVEQSRLYGTCDGHDCKHEQCCGASAGAGKVRLPKVAGR